MFAAALTLLAAFDLGVHFAKPEAWNEKSEFFAVEHAKEGFVFASESRDIVNCLKHDSCVWRDMKVWETKVYFDKSAEAEKVSRVELSLYNRGDAKIGETIGLKELKQKIAAVVKALGDADQKAMPEKKQLKNGSVKYSQRFEKAVPPAELAWGLSAPSEGSNTRAVEYLRLTLLPAADGKATKAAPAKKQSGVAAKKKIKDNVTKGPNGDVFIDGVPMVDQGQKGYCAAAVSERVLRYYGNTIDEHEVAQQAGTSAEGGTSISDMKRAVTAIGEKHSLGFQEIVSLSGGIGDLEDEVARYNKAAKAEKKPALSIADYTRENMIHVSELRQAMDPKVVYAMRKKDSRFKKFSAGVRQQVNAGVPVFWGVTLGMFPERGVNPQSTGGHMRLIIGYNDKKKEILYTDTWGEGHELKRMPEDWAFAITHDAFFLKPR